MSPNTEAPKPDNVATTNSKEQTISKPRSRKRSRTAQSTLRWRAIESLRPDGERICYDPAAIKLMGPLWRGLSGIGFISRRLIHQLDSEKSGVANWIVTRTRYIDDLLKTQIEEGIKQMVILGAGYDTRAFRFHELEGKARVFEVDHIASLKFKFARVRSALKPLPSNAVLVPVDFISEKLEDKLVPRIYDKNLKTLFIWEGVTMYLTAEAVDQTLAFIANNSGKGSIVVFDYLFESALDKAFPSDEADKLRNNCARVGEPLLFGLKEESIREFLSSRGFDLVQNATALSLKDAYFKGKGQQRKIFPLTAIVSARVKRQ